MDIMEMDGLLVFDSFDLTCLILINLFLPPSPFFFLPHVSLSNAVAPTTSTVHSEFFKPCQDSQEMAFCLNEGECFIIETVAGVHRHCRWVQFDHFFNDNNKL